MCVPSIGLY